MVYLLTNLLFVYIPFLYYYINFTSSIIRSLSSGDTYLSFLNFYNFISNCITNQITGKLLFFLIGSFKAVLRESVADWSAWLRSFSVFLLFQISPVFLTILLYIFSAKDRIKSRSFYKYLTSWLN